MQLDHAASIEQTRHSTVSTISKYDTVCCYCIVVYRLTCREDDSSSRLHVVIPAVGDSLLVSIRTATASDKYYGLPETRLDDYTLVVLSDVDACAPVRYL